MSLAFSIGKSQRQHPPKLEKNPTPGVGQYELKEVKHSAPKWGQGTASKFFEKKLEDEPGPGHYDSKFSTVSVFSRSPSPTFGDRFQIPNSSKNNPGAGYYDPSIEIVASQSPKYSFRTRVVYDQYYKMKVRSQSPPPNIYETNKSSVINIPSSVIGTSQRHSPVPKDHVPGAGSYLQSEYEATTPKYKFGGERRKSPDEAIFQTTKELKNLGPGSHEIKSMLRTDGGFVMGKKLPVIEDHAKVPGVGHYEGEKIKVLNRSPTFRVGKETRGYSPDAKLKNKLGPGDYNPSIELVKQNDPVFSVGKDKRLNYYQVPHSPGIGAYESKSTIYDCPKWSLQSRHLELFDTRETRQIPSPSQYNSKLTLVKERQNNWVIGSSQRHDPTRQYIAPGPGKYESDKKPRLTPPKFTFGKENRKFLDQPELKDVPGPGQYEIKPSLANLPKYSIPEPTQTKIHL